MGKTKIHPMIVLFLFMSVSPSFISELFKEIYPNSLIRENELRRVLKANQKIYDDVKRAREFLRDYRVDQSSNVESITESLHLCPWDSKRYIQKWIDKGWRRVIINDFIEGINFDLIKLDHLIKLLKALISIVDKSCCNGRERYDHGDNNLPEYLRDLIREIAGNPEPDEEDYTPTWAELKFILYNCDQVEFWEAIRENGRYEYW